MSSDAAQVYRVGGAIRDALLGLPVHDQDFVVVGAVPEEMISLGFVAVGRDFPVFLHPSTQEEYALARTERKTGPGYRGFDVHFDSNVTLEQDLARRDLTINAMAQRVGTLNECLHQPPQLQSWVNAFRSKPTAYLIEDPFKGHQDLASKIFRHVSEAFVEDPVRVLRLARFAARFTDFNVSDDTSALVRKMARGGELNSLVAERVWQEMSRALLEKQASRCIDFLGEHDCLRASESLAVLTPALQGNWRVPLDSRVQFNANLAQRFAVLTHKMNKAALEKLCDAWRVPNECRELAYLLGANHSVLCNPGLADANGLLDLIERCDAKRRPERFAQLIQAAQALGEVNTAQLEKAVKAINQVDDAAVAKADPGDVKKALRQARLIALQDAAN